MADRACSRDARGSVKGDFLGMIPEPTGTTAIATNPYDTAIVKIEGTILNYGSSGEDVYNDGTAAVTSLGYNLSSDNGGGFLTATGDRINTDPLLGPLQDNGGPSLTPAGIAKHPRSQRAMKNLAGFNGG